MDLTLNFCWCFFGLAAVLGVHNLVNNPKFDEGTTTKDGKEIVKSKWVQLLGIFINSVQIVQEDIRVAEMCNDTWSQLPLRLKYACLAIFVLVICSLWEIESYLGEIH